MCGERLFARVSSSLYENAVRLHRAEHLRLAAREWALLQFQEKLTGLKKQIDQRRDSSNYNCTLTIAEGTAPLAA
jgi:hypothetical protein